MEPNGLVNADRRWYLVALDLDRADWRTVRVDRMTEPALAGHRFVRTLEPDVASMVADGLAFAPHTWQAEVLLGVDESVAASEIPRTFGTLEPVAGGTLLRIGGTSWTGWPVIWRGCPSRRRCSVLQSSELPSGRSGAASNRLTVSARDMTVETPSKVRRVVVILGRAHRVRQGGRGDSGGRDLEQT